MTKIVSSRIYRCQDCDRIFQFPDSYNDQTDYYEEWMGVNAIKGVATCPECKPIKKCYKRKLAIVRAGMTFGKLRVVKELKPRVFTTGRIRCRIWLCKCDCGELKEMIQAVVRKQKHCGCVTKLPEEL